MPKRPVNPCALMGYQKESLNWVGSVDRLIAPMRINAAGICFVGGVTVWLRTISAGFSLLSVKPVRVACVG